MKRIILIIITVTLYSCDGKKAAQETYQHGEFKLELLFEKDGCKMYRFFDGRTVYWANCEGRIQADYESSNGKSRTTHKEETIITK